jgi:branched-chain amino acid transport system substrate-binding protein
MRSATIRSAAFWTALITVAAANSSALAQKKYDTGATDTEVKIGNIVPYSGPASAYGIIGKSEEAYFKMINENGGINGRKIKFISYDDAYSPPKAVEQVRKLVESDEVLLVFNALGTPSNTAIQKYLNSKKVPQLFVATGATKWNDPTHFPWTIGWQPSYQSEARIYAKYLMKEKPDAKIAVLYQNDDFGKEQPPYHVRRRSRYFRRQPEPQAASPASLHPTDASLWSVHRAHKGSRHVVDAAIRQRA